ncbi:MAG TPA: type IV pilus modification protein PilV [Crenotrichaceae bacterium]|nr:type IV pilus modification protein PilV [Crenotrichaceae bacterium]
MKQFNSTSAHCYSGFTMVEFLVSILVLSIGLIGLAGLQVTSLRDNSRAYMRSQASVLASDLADRVRANPTINYTTVTASENTGCLTTAGCSATQMAQQDLFEWNNNLPSELTSGEGVICFDSTPNDGTSAASAACDGMGATFAIKIWWQDKQPDSSGTVATPQRYIMSFRR